MSWFSDYAENRMIDVDMTPRKRGAQPTAVVIDEAAEFTEETWDKVLELSNEGDSLPQSEMKGGRDDQC